METSKRDLKIEIPNELKPLAGKFLERRRLEAETLKTLAEACNYQSIAVIAHRLKGNGTGYGFPALSSVGKDLEQAAKQEDDAAISKLVEEFRTLVIHFQNTA